MKIININPGILPIPPNGWGAIEKIIWDYHQEMLKIGIRSEIKYLNDVNYDDSVVVHVHVANLANMLHERGIPYIFSIHDHHAFLYGKDSDLFKENLKAIENSVFSLSPCKYLIPYFGSKKLRYFSHAVNTNVFKFNDRQRHAELKLLCVANNGYAYDQSIDRKGFKIAIQAAKNLGLPLTIAGPRNNDNFFKTLDPELNNYPRLTKLYDLEEKWLIHLYNEHDAFLHFSELEAGHPNLTLLEAMACGLPVVGTFEDPSYKGMLVCNRDVSEAEAAIKTLDKNFESVRKDALLNADANSYKTRVHELTKLYSEYREKIFGNKIVAHYESAQITKKEARNKINVTFSNGPKVEINGPIEKKYKVKFIDLDTNSVVYESVIGNNMWASTSRRYFTRWKIETYEMISDTWESIADEHIMSLRQKPVKIVLDTSSLGDLMAYIGAIDAFQRKHDCILTCVVYYDDILKLFEKNYKNVKFIRVNDQNENYYAVYNIGYYDNNNWQGNLKTDPRNMSLAITAQSVLGLPETEILPKFQITPTKSDKKYVCIATQSTAQAKYWNNPNGWNDVVNYLKNLGYEVWDIDLHSSFGLNQHMNYIPAGAVDKTGKLTLEERMSQLAGAEFFIGLGSGLSWLAWATGKKVILISGFSQEFAEFFTPYRVINKNVCHGCWNDVSCTFDKGNWLWCPRNKDFECTKQISSQMVIEKINALLSPDDYSDFDWGTSSENTKRLFQLEFFSKKSCVYERFFEVEKDDVVLDLGAHVGAFCYSIKNKNPSRVIALEPGKSRMEALTNNTRKLNATVLNLGISNSNNHIKNGMVYEDVVEDFNGITFGDLVKNYNIEKIDFLKIDCEGGEYEVFSPQYIDWIKKNVRKISGEWHIHSQAHKQQFRSFRDNILSQFKNYEVYSVDGVNIKWQLFTDEFIEWYREISIYIDNR